MSNDIILIILGIISALPGIIAFLLQFKKLEGEKSKLLAERKELLALADKERSEAASEIGAAWNLILGPMRTEVTLLNEKVKDQQKVISNLQRDVETLDDVIAGAHRLYNQLRLHEIDPVWRPPERRAIE